MLELGWIYTTLLHSVMLYTTALSESLPIPSLILYSFKECDGERCDVYMMGSWIRRLNEPCLYANEIIASHQVLSPTARPLVFTMLIMMLAVPVVFPRMAQSLTCVINIAASRTDSFI